MNSPVPSAPPRLYIAASGLVSPLAANTQHTYLMVQTEASGYTISPYRSKNGRPITMSLVPSVLFEHTDYELEESDPYNEQFDRIIKMAIFAVQDACKDRHFAQSIPLMLTMPEPGYEPFLPQGLLTHNLAEHCMPTVTQALTRTFFSGRAAGMEAIAFAFRYLMNNPFMLIGGSDSPLHADRIRKWDELERLLTVESADSFVPGEGACFLLLTTNPHQAQVRNGCIIALHPPGIAEEPGHMHSELPYRGDGLDQAFKKALAGQSDQGIDCIYSSMNGEHFWAKEYGVAYLRNKAAFAESAQVEHPADCYGDLGAASATSLIAMSAEHLWSRKKHRKHLVYSSSDGAQRGAVVLEKIPVNNTPS